MWNNQSSHTLEKCVLWQSLGKTLLVATTNAEHMHNLWLRHPLLKYGPNRSMYTGPPAGTWENVAALFLITPNWKLPKCSSRVEYISKLCSIHTVKCHTLIKGRKFTTCHNRDDFHKHDAELTKPNTKACLFYDSIYIKFRKRQKDSVV